MATTRIAEFSTWRPGYGLATVRVLLAGTSTLADIYSDEGLTTEIDNPQTLIERVENGISYGRFADSVYVNVPYELEINSVDRTGVERPGLTSLDGEDASEATVQVEGGSEDITLAEHLARRIDVRDYGDFLAVGELGASTATNTATLTTAIGVAGGRGGGYVEIPAGTYEISSVTVPEGVVLRGEAREATVLQSTLAGEVVTIAGNDAGLERLTLDGVTLVNNSIGVYAENRDNIIFDDVLLKRFETAVERDGGGRCNWHDLYISDCDTGYKAYASDDTLEFNYWQGGGVELCSVIGIDLRYDGEECIHNAFSDLDLDTNTGTAVRIEGAKYTKFERVNWTGNTANLTVLDDSSDNQVVGVEIVDSSINSGTMSLTGRLEKFAFRRVQFTSVAITITTPTFTILAEDCDESGVTISGTSTQWIRNETTDSGATFGLTTGNTATKAWSITLNPGDHVYLEAIVIGRQINAADHGFYHIAVSARRPGASLAYDTQTVNFTAGDTITGATSGASAVIQADSDSGSTGTLTLIDVDGTFVDNEIITGALGGSAMTNGTQSTSNAALVGSVTSLRTAQETVAGWDATFAANGPEIELQVTGATGDTVEWTGQVTAIRNT